MPATEVQKLIDYCNLVKLNLQHKNNIAKFAQSGAPKHEVSLFIVDRMVRHMEEITETLKGWK